MRRSPADSPNRSLAAFEKVATHPQGSGLEARRSEGEETCLCGNAAQHAQPWQQTDRHFQRSEVVLN